MRRLATVLSFMALVGVAGLVGAADQDASQLGRNDPAAVVKDLYAAFEAGDLEKVGGLLSPDVTWTYHGSEHQIPFAGTRKGKEGVAEFFAIVGETLRGSRQAVGEMLVQGDRVAVRGWEESTVKQTGGRYKVANVHLFTVRDNLITKFDEFIDSGAVMEAFMPADPERGRAFYTTCAGCHGDRAQGQRQMHAPNLTGLSPEYLVRQLRNYRAQWRGNAEDFYGFQMIGRASALPGDRALRDVAAYIQTMPAVSSAPTHGDAKRVDAKRGADLYASCAACHGERAEGNEALSSPPLRQLDDWYMQTQLKNFKAGIRGRSEHDTLGIQMREAAKVLPDDAAIAAVVAYIKTL